MLDISKLPAPDLIEEMDLAEITSRILADYSSRDGSELRVSDPAYRLLEVVAYREMVLRQEFNDRLRARMAAYAKGSDLDHLMAELYGIQRLVVDPGDESATPPVPPTMEGDEAFLERGLLSLDRTSTAGGRDSYRFWARTASGLVKDAAAHRGGGGVALITILTHEGDGSADPALCDEVRDFLIVSDRLPMNDDVVVQSATIVAYQITAHLESDGGPISDAALAGARAAVERYVADQHRLKRPREEGPTVIRDAVIARLYVPGVRRVILSGLPTDIDPGRFGAAWCTGVEVTTDG
jgi:phage-related baseplate assembly protein